MVETAEPKYGIIRQANPQFPVRELLVVPHNNGDLTVSYPAFGANTYKRNIAEMSKNYSHPETGSKMSFRPATTSESISAAFHDFGNLAKPEIFDPRWLQTGYVVRTSEGVFTNTIETNESSLKQLLKNDRKVNGIYLLDNNIAFAPYETFERGVQDCDTFSQGGLARALEHTSEKTALKLREIASLRHYKRGVNVWGFDPTKEPVVKVASLASGGYVVGRLVVVGIGWSGDGGCAFGVRQGEARTK
ncbi:hypothetical protein HY212_07275 [Candidatus Pacearchaeota archaeon]|nr:hypothetical protein [Candidatus Pacearchaeota archaeon]